MESQVTKIIGIALVFFGFMVAIGLSLSDKPEETRPLAYTKGVYGGADDEALSKSTVDALRRRTSRYRNSGI